jgi:hypothetical protein
MVGPAGGSFDPTYERTERRWSYVSLRSESHPEDKWSSASVVVAPGGWCWTTCCHCWCHVSGMVIQDSDSEEL